ncbi:MAG: hypothetical protein ACRCUG_07175 [Yersinia sp. (in: enterobacteria)]
MKDKIFQYHQRLHHHELCHSAVEITLLDLAGDLGVCANTVFSAVKCLEKNGLITVTRGQRSKNAIGKESAGKNIYQILPGQQEAS